MNDNVIRVENVSKQYRLGKVGTGTLSHDLNRWWHVMRGKSDPYLKIGDENERAKKANGQYVWALRNISFDVAKGEILGIIGKNGAGKSTLLKMLSRTTSPTEGSIKIRGRVASLLEVGTGFHPELTGRENVFLNGAILGMSKNEIKNKFDEIVDFSGVERYIDTPVKRYSSGMYVRLAFGVAAHLEPEILIIDEVLAVGDIEFQKKCLGKMDEVAHKGGRTVLFVSHNMAAIRSLCNRAILLKNGAVEAVGETEGIASHYLKGSNETSGFFSVGSYSDAEKVVFQETILKNQRGETTQDFYIGDDLIIELRFHSSAWIDRPYFMVGIKSKWGSICGANALIDGHQPEMIEGNGVVKCIFKNLPLLPQQYTVSAGLRASDGKTALSVSKDIGYFNVLSKLSDFGFNGLLADTLAQDSAPVLVPYIWQFGSDSPIEVDISKSARTPRRSLS